MAHQWGTASMEKLKATLAFFIPCILLGATVAGHASPADPYIVTLEQVGSNVVATGSGAIDLTGLSFITGSSLAAGMYPTLPDIFTGPAADTMTDLYTGTLSGPTSFGSGGYTAASSGSGDFVGIDIPADALFVPVSYVTNDPLSDTSTYDNATFASLGVTPGTYVWTWGSGADQSFTLDIGTTPLPATLPLFATGLGLVGLVAWRRKRRTEQCA